MPVIYDSKKIIPCQAVSCVKEFIRSEAGTVIGKVYKLQARGKFVAWMGSPDSTGAFWTQSGYPADEILTSNQLLGAHLRKQSALRKLFSNHGRVFEVQAIDGSCSLRCNPRIISIETPDANMTTLSDFIINMEADTVQVNGNEDPDNVENSFVTHASEDWTMEIVDEKLLTYRLTHTVNATGKTSYASDGTLPKQAWERAKDYCLNTLQLGLDSSKMGVGVINGAGSLAAYNYLRSQVINELTGSFSVTETWFCYAGGSAYEEFGATTRTSLEGRSTVSLTGTITGLATYDNNTAAPLTTRYDNASTKWTSVKSGLLARAQSLSGITLNPTVLSAEVGSNQVAGTIQYTYEYDNRPAPLFAGAKSTHINQDDDNAADVFANIPVIGQPLGPVLQDIGSKTAKKRTITITAQMSAATYGQSLPQPPNTNSVVQSYAPNGSPVFVDQDRVGWDAWSGQYTRTTSWTYN
jgi:hypothetical protein